MNRRICKLTESFQIILMGLDFSKKEWWDWQKRLRNILQIKIREVRLYLKQCSLCIITKWIHDAELVTPKG